MIIQCEQCHTKFKLDDAKVKDKGVKVRCAKCRHVFSVARDQSQLEPQPDFAAMLEQSADMTHEKSAPVSFELEQETGEAQSSDFKFDASSFAAEEQHESIAGSMDSASFELPREETPAAAASPSDDFDLSSLAWNDELSQQPDDRASGGDVDFAGMVAGGSSTEADKTVVSSAVFSGIEDMTIVQPPSALVKPDLEEFADSIKAQGEPAGGEGHEDKPAEPFVMSEIDFGEELSVSDKHAVNPDTLAPGHEMFFEPIEETPGSKAWNIESAGVQTETEEKPGGQDEMPPLSIASRRKQSSLVIALLAVVVLAVAGVVSYFGFSMFTGEEKTKETGRIALRAVNASFVKNSTAGEMLVISGEALNDYTVPRATIQVKGLVYGANGQVVASKTAFAGNMISNEQLATMTVEKIEAAMSNQFGDSLANMEIAPGKAIPFVVVMTNLPAEAKDYGVELVGSTISTGKK